MPRPGLIAAAVGGLVALQVAAAGEHTRPLADVTLLQGTPALSGMGHDAPRPVWYNLPDSLGAGCGFIDPARPTEITPVLEPEPQADWPSCLGFTDGAAFRWHGRSAYVFRYTQRDTREDSYPVTVYLPSSANDQALFDQLNGKDVPAKATILGLAAWGKSMLLALETAKSPYVVSAKDNLRTDHAFMVIARDPAAGSCRISMDLVAEDAGVGMVTTPCSRILATTALATTQDEYFVALLEDGDHHTRGLVFKATAHTAAELPQLEQRLVKEIAGGKVLAVKAALRKLVE